MKKFTAILGLVILGAIAGFAQSTSSDEYKRNEFAAVYTFSKAKVNQYDRDFPLITNSTLGNTFRRRETFEKGFGASGVVNFSKYAGAKADFSISFNGRKGRVNAQNFEVKERLATYTLGLQLKDNRKDAGSRFRPFANILAGVGNTKSTLKNCGSFGATCPNSLNKSRYGFVGIAGGGLDVKLGDKVSLRVIQVDYMLGKITKGWRFGSGIVF